MERNRGSIQHECATLSFYMQGGLAFGDAFMLSTDQRELMGKIIQKHYESMNPNKKNQML
jgi:hypothetical protein